LAAFLGYQERRAVWFAGALALLPLTHSYGYIYFAVFACLVLWRRRRWLLITAIASAPALVWLPFLAYQSIDVHNGFWITPLTVWGIPKYLLTMTIGYQITGAAAVLGYALMSLVIGGAFYHCWRRVELTALIVAPALIVAVISFVWRPVYLDRALLPSATLLIVYMAMSYNGGVVLPLVLAIGAAFYIFGPSIKPDLKQFYATCKGSDYTYALDTHLAIMGLSYAPSPLMVAPDSDSLAQTLRPDAKNALQFDYSELDVIHGSLCIPFVNHPMTPASERLRLESVLNRPHTESALFTSDVSAFLVYWVTDHE
jgi:hypothetical protein